MRCCVRVFSGARHDIGGHMCGKPGIIERDGKTYCKFHDPPVEQARKAKQNSKWQAKWEKKRKIWDRERLAMKALLYLERTQPDWESHA